ncbi:MAG: hypothetical protein WBW03_25050 [Silvibacterium sp.]
MPHAAAGSKNIPTIGPLKPQVPPLRFTTVGTSWQFDSTTRRIAEFAAPGICRESNRVTLTVEFGDNASDVLYALGGAGGGMALYMDKGELLYEYDMMVIERYIARRQTRFRLATRSKIAKPGVLPTLCSRSMEQRSPAQRSSATWPVPLPPARVSTWESISVRPSPSTTLIGHRSRSREN